MNSSVTGPIQKMKTTHGQPIRYELPIADKFIPVNPMLGKKISLEFKSQITCIHCSRKIKKTFAQGYCFPCFQSLAKCDMCIMRPELCHYHLNTCREPEWGKKHCLISHTVYLANSSGVKVGITRTHQQKTRWMDQGAIAAMPLATMKSRLDSGLVESELKKWVSDKTNWRNMLKNEVPKVDFQKAKNDLLEHWPDNFKGELLDMGEVFEFEYPVIEYPTKIVSHNLEKKPLLEGTLMGVKGQYLILDTAVINIRKYAGYHLEFNGTL